MARRHLSQKLWKRLLAQAPWGAEVEALVAHHLEVCAGCRQQVGTVRRKRLLPSEQAEVQALAAVLAERSSRTEPERQRAEAERDLAALMALPGPRRRARISRALSRFKSPQLVELLIQKARERVTADPFEALELAECAHDVAMRLEHAGLGRSRAMTAIARANACRGNALRACGDLRQADQLLTFALECFDREGSGDPRVEAELLTLVASLRCDQRRFIEAEAHLDMAIGLFRDLEDWLQVGSTQVKKGVLMAEAGEMERAITAAAEALTSIDARTEPKLFLAAQHNLTGYLAETGRCDEARRRLRANAPLYDQFPDAWTQLRRRWLAGKIATGLRELEEAEAIFVEVRQGFLAEGLGFLAALAGLDLALVYVEQELPGKVRELAEEMVPIFLAQDVRREATAALLLFQEAARKEAVTARMVSELAAYMRRVRRCPQRLDS